MESVLRYLEEHRRRFVAELVELLRIPSVSAKREHRADCTRAAEYVQSRFQELGLDAVLCATPGNPIVLARYHAGVDKPTVLVYGHYDVQPAEPLDLWHSPPFEPLIEEGNLYARGATDDKGQMYAHVKAAEAMIRSGGGLPVNVIYLIEGEEEIASVNLEEFIASRRDELRCDVAVISDSSQYAPGIPALCYGLRGICAVELRVEGARQDLHSGQFGGAIANPLQVLCEMISKMKDPQGRVAVPGFYDDVLELEEWERKAFASLDWNDEAFRQSLGVEQLYGEEGYTTLERKWARPTLELNGIFGGYAGEGSKTVLPAWAGIKITMRLVPHQNYKTMADRFEAFVRRLAPPTVRVSVIRQGGGNPIAIPRTAPYVDVALDALRRGFGAEPVFMREGGSIPIVSAIKDLLGVDTMLLGFGLPDDNCHAPNEKFNLDDYQCGIATAAWFMHLCSNSVSH